MLRKYDGKTFSLIFAFFLSHLVAATFSPPLVCSLRAFCVYFGRNLKEKRVQHNTQHEKEPKSHSLKRMNWKWSIIKEKSSKWFSYPFFLPCVWVFSQPFLCYECGKSFNNPSNLRQHVKRHSNLKEFHCQLCPGQFSSKGELGRP